MSEHPYARVATALLREQGLCGVVNEDDGEDEPGACIRPRPCEVHGRVWNRNPDDLIEYAKGLEAELAALREREQALVEALSLAEWSGGTVTDIGGDPSASCPVCGFAETTGHANKCEVGQALSPTEPTEARKP